MADDPSDDFDMEPARKAAWEAFCIARAEAINTYASLEHSLAMLFKALLPGADTRQAFAAFAGMSFTRSKLAAIGKLLTIIHGDHYDVFYNSLSDKILRLDGTRNKIVHWIQVGPINTKEAVLTEHPDLFAGGFLTKKEVEQFTDKAEFYRLLTMYFATDAEFRDLMDFDPPEPDKKPWRDIYREPVTYPPPTDHPLHPRHRKP